MGMTEEKRGALRLVPYMGVIYVVAEANNAPKKTLRKVRKM